MLRRLSISSTLILALACAEEPIRTPGNPDPDPNPNNGDAGVTMEQPDTGVPPLEPDAGMNNEPSGVVTVDVGSVTINASGDSDPFTFELPEGVISFSILIRGTDEGTYIIKKLDGPLGNFVTDDTANVSQIEMFLLGPFAAQFKSPNRVVQDRGLAASSFPNNPAISVSGGMYTIVLSGFTLTQNNATPLPGPVELIVEYRTQKVASGKLDVSFYFTGAGNLMASTAATDPLIMGAVDHLKMIYAQANIEIGELAYYDIDPMYQTIAGIDGTGSDLENMFKLTEGHGPGMHYFLVDRFEAGALPGANVAGIAGGLPGPALNRGSVNSGVAVALTPIMGDAAILAHVMAHEGGHWLGLFHTSEIIGTEDQMPDTPSGQQGNTFLMYPAVGGGTTISTNQAAVIRQHPEVTAVTVE